MSASPIRDLLVGLFVFAGISAVAYLSVTVGGFTWNSGPQRTLYAAFDEVGGLKPRAQVVIGSRWFESSILATLLASFVST